MATFNLEESRESLDIDHSFSTDIPRVSNKHTLTRHETSTRLIDALGKLGEQYETEESHKQRVNLSFTDPVFLAIDTSAAWREAQKKKSQSENKFIWAKDILVEYLRTLGLQPRNDFPQSRDRTAKGDEEPPHLLKVFSQERLEWLHLRNWDITDVVTWAWILTAPTTELAVQRLEFAGRGDTYHFDGKPNIPQFILPFLLRRKNGMTPRALKMLLVYTWRYMERLTFTRRRESEPLTKSPTIPNPFHDVVGMHEFMFMIVIIRFIRISLSAWPAALPNIAALFCQYLDGVNFGPDAYKTSKAVNTTAALTNMYNVILKQIARRSEQQTILSAKYQEEAQFIVLRRMNEFRPALAVDRFGYRAITSVQIMGKKTDKERRWAGLKSERWPPWKEEKLGIDADIGPEYGFSRAKMALDRAKEAGYSGDGMDDMMEVLTGWDTDDSPTIQYRTSFTQNAHASGLAESESANVYLWWARIKATRTLDEAWSAFLSWKEQRSTRKNGSMAYTAVFQKLIDVNRFAWMKGLVESHEDVADPILAGDHDYVLPSPSPGGKSVRVSTPIPSIDSLFEQMRDDNVKMQVGLLCLLIENATSFAAVEQYLRYAGWSIDSIFILLYDWKNLRSKSLSREFRRSIDAIGPSLVRFFCRLPALQSRVDKQPDTRSLQEHYPFGNPLELAISLAYVVDPFARALWLNLIHGLAISSLSARSLREDEQHMASIHNWQMIQKALKRMEKEGVMLNFRIFKSVCYGLRRATLQAREILKSPWKFPASMAIEKASLADILNEHSRMVKEMWNKIVGPSQSETCERRLKLRKDHSNPTLDALVYGPPDDAEEVVADKNITEVEEEQAPLPTAQLTPLLFEIPDFHTIEVYVQLLGVIPDYEALVDLADWVAAQRNEIEAWSSGYSFSDRSRRRCMLAFRVFMLRSWRGRTSSNSNLEALPGDKLFVDDGGLEVGPPLLRERPFDPTIAQRRRVREVLTEAGFEWPTEEDAEGYLRDRRLVGESWKLHRVRGLVGEELEAMQTLKQVRRGPR